MKLHLGTKAFKIHVNDQAFKMHIGNDLPVEIKEYTLSVSWQAGIRDVSILRNGIRILSTDKIYTNDVLQVEVVPVEGVTVRPYVQTYIVDSDVHIHIETETDIPASNEQDLYLQDGTELRVALEDGMYYVYADLPGLKTICNNCNWGTNSIGSAYPTDSNPIEIYNIETDDGGYILDEAYTMLETPEAEARYIRTNGSYLGSIWVADNKWCITYKHPEIGAIANYYELQSNQIFTLPTAHQISVEYEPSGEDTPIGDPYYRFTSDSPIEIIRKGQQPIFHEHEMEHWGSGNIAEYLIQPGDILYFYLFDVYDYDNNYDNGYADVISNVGQESEYIQSNGVYLGCATVNNDRWCVRFNYEGNYE